MFHSQTMSPYFVLPSKHAKYKFKTTIMRDGVKLARPINKIPKLSRDSRFKVARTKARTAMRNRVDQYDDDDANRADNYYIEKSFHDYANYCIQEMEYKGYIDLAYEQYFKIPAHYFTTNPTKQKKTYSPPQVRPDSDVCIAHWPKRVKWFKSYAQIAR